MRDFYLVNFSRECDQRSGDYRIAGGEVFELTYNLKENSAKIAKASDDNVTLRTECLAVSINHLKYPKSIWFTDAWRYELQIEGTSTGRIELTITKASENSSLFFTEDVGVNRVLCGGDTKPWACDRVEGGVSCRASCEGNIRFVYDFLIFIEPGKSAAVDVSASSQSGGMHFRAYVSPELIATECYTFSDRRICNRISYTSMTLVLDDEDAAYSDAQRNESLLPETLSKIDDLFLKPEAADKIGTTRWKADVDSKTITIFVWNLTPSNEKYDGMEIDGWRIRIVEDVELKEEIRKINAMLREEFGDEAAWIISVNPRTGEKS